MTPRRAAFTHRRCIASMLPSHHYAISIRRVIIIDDEVDFFACISHERQLILRRCALGTPARRALPPASAFSSILSRQACRQCLRHYGDDDVTMTGQMRYLYALCRAIYRGDFNILSSLLSIASPLLISCWISSTSRRLHLHWLFPPLSLILVTHGTICLDAIHNITDQQQPRFLIAGCHEFALVSLYKPPSKYLFED